MSSGRCAACKYLRRRCPSDCIFAPYFPSNNPQRFACVHRIYGASNVGKMLQQLPAHLRAEAADSMHFEAQRRIEEPVYGCVGIINQLYQQIHNAKAELAKTRAEIAFATCNILQDQQTHHHHQLLDHVEITNHSNFLPGHSNTDQSSLGPTFVG